MAEQYTSQRGDPTNAWSDENAARGAPNDSAGSVSRCIREWPEESVLVAFASGVAIGVGLGIALGGAEVMHRQRDRRLAEGMGERLLATFDRVLPDSLGRTLGLNR